MAGSSFFVTYRGKEAHVKVCNKVMNYEGKIHSPFNDHVILPCWTSSAAFLSWPSPKNQTKRKNDLSANIKITLSSHDPVKFYICIYPCYLEVQLQYVSPILSPVPRFCGIAYPDI